MFLDKFYESWNRSSFDGIYKHFWVAGQRMDDIDNVVESFKAVESVDIIYEFGEVKHQRYECLLNLLSLILFSLFVDVEHKSDLLRQLLIKIL